MFAEVHRATLSRRKPGFDSPWARHASPKIVVEIFAPALGSNPVWKGAFAIDSEHLRMIADHQAPFAAAEVAAWQVEMGVSNV